MTIYLREPGSRRKTNKEAPQGAFLFPGCVFHSGWIYTGALVALKFKATPQNRKHT